MQAIRLESFHWRLWQQQYPLAELHYEAAPQIPGHKTCRLPMLSKQRYYPLMILLENVVAALRQWLGPLQGHKQNGKPVKRYRHCLANIPFAPVRTRGG